MYWEIPRTTRNPLPLDLAAGSKVFIVGANGSGKSALIHNFVRTNPDVRSKRISAHRQTWFDSDEITMTPAQRRQVEDRIAQVDRRNDALWKEYSPGDRLSAVLFDLVAKENARARSIAEQIDAGNPCRAKCLANESRSPFNRVNEILRAGNLNVSLMSGEGGEIIVNHRDSKDTFSITQMSDGERNAVIIAAIALTVDSDTVLLIDEPERHLHRSIIEPFFSALLESRSDCTFIISTHDISLPMAYRDALVLLVRSCIWRNRTPAAWDVEQLDPNHDFPDDFKRAIIGSRRVILFVEGTHSSADFPIFAALFPSVSIVPKGRYRNVIQVVNGLNDVQANHDVRAFGLIDADFQTPDRISKLAESNVFALRVHSVESLYYCSESIAAVAERQTGSFGGDANEMFDNALNAALETLTPNNIRHLAARKSETAIRNRVLTKIPTSATIQSHEGGTVTIEVDSPFETELGHLNQLISNREFDAIVSRYPVRDSGIAGAVIKVLEIKTLDLYQRTLVTKIRSDPELAEKLRAKFGPLTVALFNALSD